MHFVCVGCGRNVVGLFVNRDRVAPQREGKGEEGERAMVVT